MGVYGEDLGANDTEAATQVSRSGTHVNVEGLTPHDVKFSTAKPIDEKERFLWGSRPRMAFMEQAHSWNLEHWEIGLDIICLDLILEILSPSPILASRILGFNFRSM